MSVPQKTNLRQRIRSVMDCHSDAFRDLLYAGGFEPAHDLRYRNLSGLSFAGEDLRGMNFSGANLCGCNFENAMIEGACFDQARLGQVIALPGRVISLNDQPIHAANLQRAKDWKTSKHSDWERAHTKMPDDHLPVGTIFRDVLRAPQMIVLPVSAIRIQPENHTMLRIAVSRFSIGGQELYPFRGDRSSYPKRDGRARRTDAIEFCDKLSRKTGRSYRLPTNVELVHACGAPSPMEHAAGQPNSFGVLIMDEDDSILYNESKDSNLELGRHSSEWCSDSASPIYLTGVGLIGKEVESSGNNTEAWFHVVRDMEDDF